MPGTATVALPRRDRDAVMTAGLRGEAAIVGIAELPAQRKQTRPELFTIDQYAALAAMVIEDAGLDASVINGLICHGIAESEMFAPATLSEYLGLPIDFGERVDLGGATSAGMVWRAAVAVELGLCDAVLAVVPGSTMLPRSQRRPAGATRVVRGVEQQVRLTAGRIRDPLRQRRPERALRPDRAALRRALRLRPGGAGEDRRRPAHQRLRAPRRGLPRQAAHRSTTCSTAR